MADRNLDALEARLQDANLGTYFLASKTLEGDNNTDIM